MGRLHERLNEHGQLTLRLGARSTEERRLIDTAARFLGDESVEPAFSHPGLCLTVLPHRERPRQEIWRRVNGPVSLTVQPTADQTGAFHGVPHGAKARLILLYLQTEAVKTNSRHVELGRSMHAWLCRMGVKPSGTNYSEVNRQAHKIENCLLAHPAVTECAVVGYEVEGLTLPRAFVVAGAPVSARELQDFVRSRLAPHKYPRDVRFVDALPYTSSGKLDRRALHAPRAA